MEDTLQQYFTGTISTSLSSSFARGCVLAASWLPSDYELIGGVIDPSKPIDYLLSRLLIGKLPAAASDAERLYNVYTDPHVSHRTDPGWLSTADTYFTETACLEIPAGAVMGYTIALHESLKQLWPKDAEELSRINIVLIQDGVPVDPSKYVVDLHGLWWSSDRLDDLPVDIYTETFATISVSVTKEASLGDVLPGATPVDETLIDPVEGAGGLDLNVLNIGADQCPAVPRTIRVHCGQTVTVNLVPYDRTGSVVDLSGQAYLPIFVVKEGPGSGSLLQKYECTTDPGDSRITLAFMLDKPGVFLAQLLIYSVDGTQLLFVTDYYINVDPVGVYHGTVTIPEIRMHVMDVCPAQNDLLETFEYSDTNIAVAIQSTIDYYNGLTAQGSNWTSSSLPAEARYFFKQGVAGLLMKTRAHQMLRNALPYNAGGVSLDENSKYNDYLAIGERLMSEWQNYVLRKHYVRNFKRSWMVLN